MTKSKWHFTLLLLKLNVAGKMNTVQDQEFTHSPHLTIGAKLSIDWICNF